MTFVPLTCPLPLSTLRSSKHTCAVSALQDEWQGHSQTPLFHPFHCSGLGVVPKQDGSWRIITHLSAPDGTSINDYIDPESVTLSYTTIDDAVRIALQLGRATLMANIDHKKAF